MKRQPKPPRPRPMRLSRRGAGADARRTDSTPTPGWKAFSAMRLGWRNPRTPAVPATLDLTLDEYFAATSLMGLLASQAQEPNQRWCCDWSFKMGHTMAREARRRRR